MPQRTAPTGDVVPRLRAALPALQGGDASVVRSILADPERTVYRSVSEAAEAAGTSTATVVRAAQKLGFKGFHDLKLALAQSLRAFAGETDDDQADTAPELQTLAHVARAGARTVLETLSLIEAAPYAAAVKSLASAKHVLFTAVGTSAPLAQDAAYRFSTIGLNTAAPADVHTQHVSACLLSSKDVCFAISHSGATRETLAALESASTTGATTIALTSYLRSPLTELADIVLTAGSREISFRLEATASRLAHVVVLDALLVDVASADQERAQRTLDLYSAVLTEHRL